MKTLPLCLLLLGASSGAQGVGHLFAGRYEAARGQTLEVRLDQHAADRWSPAPWPTDLEWVFVRVAGTQENLPELQPDRPGDASVRVPLVRAGVTLVATDLVPRLETWTSEALPRHLAELELQGHLLADWRASAESDEVRLRRLESHKLLVRSVGPAGWMPNSATAQSKTGQRAELRPLADPTSMQRGSDLPLRVYFPHGPKENVRVLARHRETGRTQAFLTDREGTGFLSLEVAGLWTVEAHQLRVLPTDGDAELELVSATLTFELPPWDPRQAAPGSERAKEVR